MRLIRARFSNFRLLRDLTLEFPISGEQHLTVIRAANESGKTTIFYGLQWALYGDSAFEEGRSTYRLHPIDWDTSLGSRVPISVELDFEKSRVRRTRSGRLLETTEAYRIIRSSYDLLDGDTWRPGPTSAKVFHLTASGAHPLDPSEAWLREELPPDLREVFFTDGDRALRFIESGVSSSTKQQRVGDAIKILLDLDVIESSRDRIKKTISAVNRRAKSIISDSLVTATVDQLTELDNESIRLHKLMEDAKRQFTSFDERYAAIDRKISDLLKQGNREDLSHQLDRTRQTIKRVDADLVRARRDHSKLLTHVSLSRDLITPVISRSISALNAMRDQGKIPNSTIPVLTERLRCEECICGEQLFGTGPAEKRRREHIKRLIAVAQSADLLQSIVTDLYYASTGLSVDATDSQDWIGRYTKIAGQRDDLEMHREELGIELKRLEARLKDIPDTDIQGLQDSKQFYREQRDRFHGDYIRYRVDQENVTNAYTETKKKLKTLLKRQRRGSRVIAELEVAQDIQTVLHNTYLRLTTDELNKVSTRMNYLFLRMIGSDPTQGAIIRGAHITEQFDIVVEGPKERPLNPDRDLNGASRRALTLAFILALVYVSEVEAPNVIDTPLGMMSGFVKTSVLTRLVEESSQLILLLTPDEIVGCDDILDSEAASVITLTNPVHYPTMVVNDPNTHIRTILKCGCNHRLQCTTCQRYGGPKTRLKES